MISARGIRRLGCSDSFSAERPGRLESRETQEPKGRSECHRRRGGPGGKSGPVSVERLLAGHVARDQSYDDDAHEHEDQGHRDQLERQQRARRDDDLARGDRRDDQPPQQGERQPGSVVRDAGATRNARAKIATAEIETAGNTRYVPNSAHPHTKPARGPMDRPTKA